MNGISFTAYFQFWPRVFKESHRDGMMIAEMPLYSPLIPSSRIVCLIEQINAGYYFFASLISMSAPQTPIGTRPME